MDFYCFETKIGFMALGAEDGALVRVYLPGTPTPRLMPRATPLLLRAEEQLRAYLDGERQDFDLPVAPAGTPFRQSVWAALRSIPYGQTRTYQDIAEAVGSPDAARAVGAACACNPLPLIIPCHRVVGSDGSLTGYAGGLELKQTLLALEQSAKK